MTPEEIKSMQAYAAAFGQPEASEQQARKPQVGDSILIRPEVYCTPAGILAAQQARQPCVIREIEDDPEFNLPYYVEAPNGDFEWLRAGEFDVVTVTELSEAVGESKIPLPVNIGTVLRGDVPAPCQCCNPPKLHASYVEGTTGGLEIEVYFCDVCGADWGMTEAWGFGARIAIEKMRAECEALQARVTLLTERLTPFAKAALDKDVQRADQTEWLLIDSYGEKLPVIVDGRGWYLSVRHLDEALEALPDVAGSANADSDQA